MMPNEIIHYWELCRDKYPENFAIAQDGGLYSQAQKDSAAAEIAYYLEHGELPDWGYIIESAESYGENVVFVYADPKGFQ